jgi:hypothetical protein
VASKFPQGVWVNSVQLRGNVSLIHTCDDRVHKLVHSFLASLEIEVESFFIEGF